MQQTAEEVAKVLNSQLDCFANKVAPGTSY